MDGGGADVWGRGSPPGPLLAAREGGSATPGDPARAHSGRPLAHACTALLHSPMPPARTPRAALEPPPLSCSPWGQVLTWPPPGRHQRSGAGDRPRPAGGVLRDAGTGQPRPRGPAGCRAAHRGAGDGPAHRTRRHHTARHQEHRLREVGTRRAGEGSGRGLGGRRLLLQPRGAPGPWFWAGPGRWRGAERESPVGLSLTAALSPSGTRRGFWAGGARRQRW